MPASIHQPRPPTKDLPDRLRRQLQHLQTLLEQGKLCWADFNLCLTLANCLEEPETDDMLAWLGSITEEDLAERRESLRAQGVIDFTPATQPGSFVYHVREPGAAAPRRVYPSKEAGEWVALEQGSVVHRMREDDLFAAERTRCGRPTLDEHGRQLPRFNAPAADYRPCRRCTQPRSRFQVPL